MFILVQKSKITIAALLRLYCKVSPSLSPMKQLMLKYSFLPLLVLLTSCWKEPNFPKEPEIEPSYVTQKTIRDVFGQPVAEVTIAIKFKDGDGDLGLNDEDILKPPFNEVPGNKFTNNYFVETLIEQNGV